MKKHKTWEGDGILSVTNGNHVTLMNMSGQIMSQSKGHKVAQLVSLCEGSKLTIGGKEIEIVNVMGEDEIHSCFDYHKEPPSSDPPKVILQATKKFQNPLKDKNKLCPVNIKKKCVPLYDTLSPDSLILTRPNQNHQLLYNVDGLPVVDVVVDPRLVKHLRPHQREGVVFLYECVMNMREFNGSGAILG
jgi:DNA repair and recombination protein RAD54B